MKNDVDIYDITKIYPIVVQKSDEPGSLNWNRPRSGIR